MKSECMSFSHCALTVEVQVAELQRNISAPGYFVFHACHLKISGRGASRFGIVHFNVRHEKLQYEQILHLLGQQTSEPHQLSGFI
uniref:Uncharacterized protein n=1 Tax=Anguilla anguilla TaxID=7936 RepID=A0A0E9X6F2_ANGAN